MSLEDRQIEISDIVSAYRLILGRKPDRAGLDSYHSHARRGMTLMELRSEFLASPEFRNMLGQPDWERVLVGNAYVDIDPTEVDFGRNIFLHGDWEGHLVHLIVNELREGDVFVDIGANVGVMSFNAAKVVGPYGKVIAFEPLQANVNHLIRGIVMNDLRNTLIYPLALSNGSHLFSIEGSSNGYLAPPVNGRPQAMTFRGDDLLSSEPKIDFIKIDIEGHEPFAIDGLSATISKSKPRVLCEFNPRCLKTHAGHDPEMFADQLFKLTSALHVIEFNGNTTRVTDRRQLMDLWADRNKVAVDTKHLPDGMLHFDLFFKAE